jgi:hypothetical protein
MQCVRDCNSPNKEDRKFFEQPVVQTLQMFIGEMGCWLVVGASSLYSTYRSRRSAEYQPVLANDEGDTAANGDYSEDNETDPLAAPLKNPDPMSESGRMPLLGWRVILLALPATCDIAGTTLMNVGLLFVAASIYQMTRGALVLFVGLFSVWFLKRRLGAYKWFALFVVVLGVAVVGLAGALQKDHRATPKATIEALARAALEVVKRGIEKPPKEANDIAVRTVVGVLLIAGAQIFTATQFVLEESIMEKYALEPLRVVGWEGLFGTSITLIAMIILHFTVGVTKDGKYGYFDAREGLREVFEYRAIGISSLLCMISIG